MEEFYIAFASDAWDEREGPLIVALFAFIVFVPCFIAIICEAIGTGAFFGLVLFATLLFLLCYIIRDLYQQYRRM